MHNSLENEKNVVDSFLVRKGLLDNNMEFMYTVIASIFERFLILKKILGPQLFYIVPCLQQSCKSFEIRISLIAVVIVDGFS